MLERRHQAATVELARQIGALSHRDAELGERALIDDAEIIIALARTLQAESPNSDRAFMAPFVVVPAPAKFDSGCCVREIR